MIVNDKIANSTIEDIKEVLEKEDRFVITFHVNPDYDAVGSALSLSHILKKLGKKEVLVVSEEKREVFEKTFSFIPTWDSIKEVEELKNIDLSKYVLVVLDSGEKKRIGKTFQKLISQFKIVINIDHHHDNDMFGDYNLVELEVAGTGEIVYDIAKSLGVEIDKDLAMLIYPAIVGDSGSFRFDSVRPYTHTIASELLKTGIKPSFFTMAMFQNKSLNFIKFEGEVFLNIKTCCDSKIVWAVITDEMMKKYGISDNETEPVVEDIGRIKDCVVYFTIKEKVERGLISVALRSKGDFDVSEVAKKLGGGGHKNASGVAFDLSLGVEEVEKRVLEELKKHL